MRSKPELRAIFILGLVLAIVFAIWTYVSQRKLETNMQNEQNVLQRQLTKAERIVRTEPVTTAEVAQNPVVKEQSSEPADTPLADEPKVEKYIVRKGDRLLDLFGKDAQAVCELNKLESCNRIYPNQPLDLPNGVEARKVVRVVRKVATAVVSRPVLKAQQCITLGASPFNPEHKLSRTLQGIDLLTTLTPKQKALAKEKVVMGETATKNELVGSQIFKEMLYQSKVSKKVIHVYDKPICSPEQGGKPEIMNTYDLGEGVFLADPNRCGNPAVFIVPQPAPKTPPVVKTPPPVVTVKTPPEDVPPTPTPAPVTPEKLACDEWNVHAAAGAELSKGADTRSLAKYAEGEVGACPFKWEGKDGVLNEALVAGRYHSSKDEWRGWSGKSATTLLGVGLRRTDKDGAMDLYRLMGGQRTSEGSQGLYAQDARWNVGGLYGTHYRVKPDGTNETHYRWGILLPIGGASGSATINGSATSLPRYNGSLEAGVRRYFTKQGEDWRFIGEMNASVVSPDYKGIGPRVGICNGADTLCVLAGVNVDVQNGGTAAMVGVQINTPGIVRVGRDGVIVERTAKAAEVQGVKFYFAPAETPRSD